MPRRDKLIREREHDPYQTRKKLLVTLEESARVEGVFGRTHPAQDLAPR